MGVVGVAAMKYTCRHSGDGGREVLMEIVGMAALRYPWGWWG